MTTTDSSGFGATYPTDGSSDPSKTDVAKEQAGQVAGTASEKASQVAGAATDKAGQVADTAKEQVQEVVAEATAQARNIAGELKTQVSEQAGTQRDRLVEQLRSVTDELTQMVSGGGSQSGIASEFASRVADRTNDLAQFLDGREPADILATVQQYARRKPGAFLGGAALAGLLAGRLTRGVRAANDDSDSAPTAPGNAYGGYESTYAASVPPSTYTPEIPSSTYPTTVSSAGGFSTTPGYDEPAGGYVGGTGTTTYDDPYGTPGDQGQRL